jgi:hypothetical protein
MFAKGGSTPVSARAQFNCELYHKPRELTDAA